MGKEGMAQAAAAAAEPINNLRREILAWSQVPGPVVTGGTWVRLPRRNRAKILTKPLPADTFILVLPQDWNFPHIPCLFVPFNNAIAPWRDVPLTRSAKGGMFMLSKAFWTLKRLEAVSKVLLNLFQAFVIAAIISGVLDRITSLKVRIVFGISIALLFILGVILADKSDKKEN